MELMLKDLDDSFIDTKIRVLYTQVDGVLQDYDLDYEDEVKIVVDDETYYLPRGYPFSVSLSDEDYDPAVLLGVVDPWSPFQGL